MRARPIYVEILIRAPIERLWTLTQQPELHARWDLRFTDITYLPRDDPAAPQRFLYRTRIGFGLAILGEGETRGTVPPDGGARTSALVFGSAEPLSLIRCGSGYWRYVPAGDGVRFLTRYDYHTRFGGFGRWVDALLFRPLLGWATAWSFDRLRLWLERDLDPGLAFRVAAIYALSRGTVAAVWLYHGLVPKLLVPDSGERAFLAAAGLAPAVADAVLLAAGLGEIALGLLLLMRWRDRRPLGLTIVAMAALLAGSLLTTPALAVGPFNPVTLNLAVAALGGIALLCPDALIPSAARCRRAPAPDSPEARP